MSAVSLRPVRTDRERRIFLTFPWRIYRDDPLWVPPLIPEIAKRIDPEQGALLQRGNAEFFGPARGDNLAFAVYPDSPAFRRVARLADRLRKRGQITVRGADFAQWDEEIDRVHRLLNECLAHLPDHIGWHRESLAALAQPFRQIADPELILFAEVEGETVGWFPAIPNLNEVFIRVDGLRRPWDYLKLWWLMRQPTESLTIKSVLVRPEYWNTGVPVLLFDEMAKRAVPKGYKWADMSLTSEDNPSTPLLAEHAGLELYKRYRVYRLMI
jgi:GNAT superfamily N-acetyltransferase